MNPVRNSHSHKFNNYRILGINNFIQKMFNKFVNF